MTLADPPPTAERERHARLVGAGFALFAGVAFVAMDTVSKMLVDHYSFMQVTWGRFVFHVLPLLVLLAARGRLGLVRTGRPRLQLARSALILFSSSAFVLALKYLPLADTLTISYASPLLVTALSVPLLAEKVGWRRWVAVSVGFLGVVVVIRPGFAEIHWAVVLPLMTATTMAFYNIATRMLAATDDPLTTSFYTGLVGAIVATLAVPFVWTPPDLWGWLGLFAVGFIGFVSHLAYIHAFSYAPPSFLSPLGYMGLVWATLAGWSQFGQIPDGWTFAGMAIIAGSGLYILYRESVRRRERRA